MNAPDVFCSSCGARNDSEAAFCRSCGTRLAKPVPPAAQTAPPPPPAPVAIRHTLSAQPVAAKSNSLPFLLALGAIAVLLVVVLVEAVLIVLPRGKVSQAGGATLSLLQGQVQLQKRGRSDWIEAAEDVAIEAGDHIRTGEASYAVLSFMEGTTTQLGSLTELTIRELQVGPGQKVVIRLDLGLGEMWNGIAQLPADSVHEVRTLAATVTCRGSEYGVVVNDVGTTWVRGQEGRVEVTGGGSTVPVAPGDTLMVELGSAPVSYGQVAMVPTAPAAVATSETGTASIQGADMPTFLNQPLPTGTATNTPPPTSTRRPVQPSPTPTATTRPRPTATTPVCPTNCPTFKINVPSTAPPYGLFGIEWDGSAPAGWSYVLEFSQDQASWGRTPILKWKDSQGLGELWPEGGHTKAEIHGPGPGDWFWRVCIVRSETGPSCCCGPSHTIVHQRDDSC